MISPAFGLAEAANATSVQALAECYGRWVGIRSNHVVSQAGEFSGADGSSRSISSQADGQLLKALRSYADLIVVDAETARRERYKIPSSGASLAIFSQTGSFTGIPALEENPERCFLFSPKASQGIENRQHVPITSLENPLLDLDSWAKTQDFSAILLEAGPTLSQLAFDNHQVSESALTISRSKLDPESLTSIHPFDKSAMLLSVAHSEGDSFTYWRH